MKTRQDKPWQEAPGAADLPLGPQDIGALIARIDSTDPNALIGLPLFDLVDLLLEAGVEVL